MITTKNNINYEYEFTPYELENFVYPSLEKFQVGIWGNVDSATYALNEHAKKVKKPTIGVYEVEGRNFNKIVIRENTLTRQIKIDVK